MTERKEWTVLGVSGVTCGGKTTVTSALHAAFPGSVVVNQDSYFLPPDDKRHIYVPGLNHHNWELITSLDMDRMITDIKQILARPAPEVQVPLLIIEGFLIFKEPYILSISHRKLFFTLTYDECWARRSVRPYDPADPPGYFEQVVWPEYEKYLDLVLRTVPDLKFIPGTRDVESVVLEYCRLLADDLNCKI